MLCQVAWEEEDAEFVDESGPEDSSGSEALPSTSLKAFCPFYAAEKLH